MPITYFLAQVMGIFFLIVGVSLFQKKGFGDIMDNLVANRGLLYVTGIVSVVCGLLVVLIHNVWDEGFLALLVTLIGWLTLIKGTFLLFMSGGSVNGYMRVMKVKQLSWLFALVAIVIGVYLTYAGFMG